jgi:hypothetical protein
VSAALSNVFLREGASGRLVPAILHGSIQPRHLDDHQQHWKPLMASSSAQHNHWDWRQKVRHYSSRLSHQSFAIECAGVAQGLMIVNTMKRCRIPAQANRHLVYVEYLEAAPWNRGAGQLYKGVGTVMIAVAIQLSIEEGNQGRVGLHSLPQADSFYGDHCGMTDLGPDTSCDAHFPLRYFEMTQAQAAIFLKGPKSDET